MLVLVRSRIIDGERWIAERLKFLREQLARDPADEERQAIEAEIRVLSQERGLTVGGRRIPRVLRLLRRKK
jgi:hypothetical protein